MGTDRKYGKVTTEHGDIPGDEPVIVFRAHDIHAPALLECYRMLCSGVAVSDPVSRARVSPSPERHLDLISGTLDQFLRWQMDNPEKIRIPDSERSRAWMES